MDIKQNNRNELFKRQELVAEIESEKNPGFEEVKKMIAESIGKPVENFDVKKIQGSFGKRKFMVEAYIYDSEEELKKMKKLEITRKQRRAKKTETLGKKQTEGEEKTDDIVKTE